MNENVELEQYLDESDLLGCIQSLLLITDSPLSIEDMHNVTGHPIEIITDILKSWSNSLKDSGIELRENEEGWRLYTNPKYSYYVEQLLLKGARSNLSQAALETLAVVAYRQPVTRTQVGQVRGVNVDSMIRTLTSRGLIEQSKIDQNNGAAKYVTTELFLERLGISSISELPELAPLLPEANSIEILEKE